MGIRHYVTWGKLKHYYKGQALLVDSPKAFPLETWDMLEFAESEVW